MNRKIKLAIGLLIVLAITILDAWSVWFGRNNAQTGFQHIASMADQNQSKINTPDEVMFLGDSITAHEDWNVLFGVNYIVNAGVNGNTTDDVIARLSPLLMAKPQKIFLMIGVNDLLRGKDVTYVLANYELIINRIKSESPNSLIYIQSVLPVNNDVSHFGTVNSQKILMLNEKLQQLADGKKEIYINLYPNFCGPDNKLYDKYSNDGLHLNANGYTVWKNLISGYVK